MDVVRQQVTADELLLMPDDGFRYELVKGELRRMTPAGNVHGRVTMNVGISLGGYVKAHDLGAVYAAETGFRLSSDPDTVRAPDVAFVSQANVEAVGEVEGFWPGAPDLAVEVVSPTDSYADVEENIFDWLDAGTKMVVVTGKKAVAPVRQGFRFAWDAPRLCFSVREPFVSKASSAGIVWGNVRAGEKLEVVSQMPQDGVIFSDGVEADYLAFDSGAVASISVAEEKASLVAA